MKCVAMVTSYRDLDVGRVVVVQKGTMLSITCVAKETFSLVPVHSHPVVDQKGSMQATTSVAMVIYNLKPGVNLDAAGERALMLYTICVVRGTLCHDLEVNQIVVAPRGMMLPMKCAVVETSSLKLGMIRNVVKFTISEGAAHQRVLADRTTQTTEFVVKVTY
uniref:Uncharacterized protein n=1 Tax=Clytia hemisphaerica TaxID=252671 RepID=A0A7M5UZY9_9CNID